MKSTRSALACPVLLATEMKLLSLLGFSLVAACTSNSTGAGTIDIDNTSIGAVSSWAEPTGVSVGDNGPTTDFSGWTIHFSHALPGVDCGTAPDLADSASVDIITTQTAERAVLVPGAITVVADYPTEITQPFAVGTIQTTTTLTAGTVTITAFTDSTIEGTLTANGDQANTTPSAVTVDGSFQATRCVD